MGRRGERKWEEEIRRGDKERKEWLDEKNRRV